MCIACEKSSMSNILLCEKAADIYHHLHVYDFFFLTITKTMIEALTITAMAAYGTRYVPVLSYRNPTNNFLIGLACKIVKPEIQPSTLLKCGR